MANATIGNTQQISRSTLEAIWQLNANILLYGSDKEAMLQLRVVNELFGYVEHRIYGESDREELLTHQKGLQKLMLDTRSA